MGFFTSWAFLDVFFEASDLNKTLITLRRWLNSQSYSNLAGFPARAINPSFKDLINDTGI